ncbi:MAG TPA: helix-turn-helix domain-containing protein [Clostridiaceae bacterium]|nr:helix-turn-helix domain-containing protein [Clostridiaceae bacterium]
MGLYVNVDELGKLLNSLFLVTGRKFTLKDDKFNDVITSKTTCEFCKLIQNTQFGLEKCLKCDQQALTEASKKNEVHFYRCHAGLIEAAIPVMVEGQILAYFMYGQVLDDSSPETQWLHVKQLCKWHPDISALYDAFCKLDHLSHSTLNAYANMLSAFASYIWLQEYVKSQELSDAQRLINFINRNYMKRLTLESISLELGIGRTKLCETAKEHFACSVMDLIRQRRVEVAKKLLIDSDLSVGQVANEVGISDSSYFAKVFKSTTGCAPFNYRKQSQKTLNSRDFS